DLHAVGVLLLLETRGDQRGAQGDLAEPDQQAADGAHVLPGLAGVEKPNQRLDEDAAEQQENGHDQHVGRQRQPFTAAKGGRLVGRRLVLRLLRLTGLLLLRRVARLRRITRGWLLVRHRASSSESGRPYVRGRVPATVNPFPNPRKPRWTTRESAAS